MTILSKIIFPAKQQERILNTYRRDWDNKQISAQLRSLNIPEINEMIIRDDRYTIDMKEFNIHRKLNEIKVGIKSRRLIITSATEDIRLMLNYSIEGVLIERKFFNAKNQLYRSNERSAHTKWNDKREIISESFYENGVIQKSLVY